MSQNSDKSVEDIIKSLEKIELCLLGSLDRKDPGFIEKIRQIERNQEQIQTEIKEIKKFVEEIKSKKLIAYGGILVLTIIASNISNMGGVIKGFFSAFLKGP